SHICMAFASLLWAQAFAGSGVGTAAAALADAAGADAAADAGATDAGATDPPLLGAVDAVLEVQAATNSTATIARAGSLRWVLIQCSSNRPGRGLPASGRRSCAPGLWHSIISEF